MRRRRTENATTPLIIGHRGASSRLPENTIEAFLGALEDGADGVEFDVRLSRDERAVVIHDATVDRTTAAGGRVADRSVAELEALGVPSLHRVLAATAHARCTMVELKTDGADRNDLVAAVLSEIASARLQTVMLLSFDHAALRIAKDVESRVETIATFAPRLRLPRPMPRGVVRRALDIGASGVALHRSLTTSAMIDACADAGLDVHAWTVNTARSASRLHRNGVSSIITDAPRLLVATMRGVADGR